MKYKYVIFDCDGVLVDSEFLACATLSEMLKPYGGNVQPEEIMSGYVGMKDVQVVKLISSRYNLSLPDNFMHQYETTLDAKLAANLSAIPGIDGVLNGLKIPKALVSNSNYSRILTSIKSAGLFSFFDVKKIFGADLAGFAKPDPRIYLYALAQLGISASEAIVIEDSPTGVSAASGAGIDVIGFLGASNSHTQKEDLLNNGAKYVTKNSQELTALLQTLQLH